MKIDDIKKKFNIDLVEDKQLMTTINHWEKSGTDSIRQNITIPCQYSE